MKQDSNSTKPRKKNYLWIAALGAFFAFVYGWEVFSGKAAIKDWVIFIGGLWMLASGLLIYFGIIKNASQKSPKEEYALFVGVSFGWGFCALYGWMDKDFAYDPYRLNDKLPCIIFCR